MIPFFVVDRPMSLNLLKFCEIDEQNSKIGLMGHANTSQNFQKLFKDFNGKNIVKMADSGVFTKDGCMSTSYEELFSKYEKMGVDYGIMIDVFKNKEKTLSSAKIAIKIHEKIKPSFKLVGVAQGKSIKEYLTCYKKLKDMGFEYVAIGGLLKKHINSARYVRVQSEEFLRKVLESIREKYPKDWLFVLGCYHPKRHMLFKELKVFGGDYKGWILNYKNPEQIIENLNKELENLDNSHNKHLEELINERNRLTIKISNLRKDKKNKTTNTAQKIRELKERRYEIDQELIKIRNKISNQRKDDEYFSKIDQLERFLKMNDDVKRDYRFKQIRSYLNNNVFSLFKKYLLVISCSQEKLDVSNPASAFELYNGPLYKSIRKMRKENNFPKDVDILIISAKYGVLGFYDLIERYDQRMTKERANELKPHVFNALKNYFKDKQYKEIFINLGKDYLPVLDGLENIIPKGARILYAKGRIGQKLKQTRDWLLNLSS